MLGSEGKHKGKVLFEKAPDELRTTKDPQVKKFIEGLIPDEVAR